MQESEASCRMLRELCLRSGVLVPPELMQSSSSLVGAASMQVLRPSIGPSPALHHSCLFNLRVEITAFRQAGNAKAHAHTRDHSPNHDPLVPGSKVGSITTRALTWLN